jgi:hypothetical protein
MQAFFKGKMYHGIWSSAKQLNDNLFLELDFVMDVNSAANRLLVELEKQEGHIDFAEAWKRWEPRYKDLVKAELEARKLGITRENRNFEEETPEPEENEEEAPTEEEKEINEMPRKTNPTENAATKSLLDKLREKKNQKTKK